MMRKSTKAFREAMGELRVVAEDPAYRFNNGVEVSTLLVAKQYRNGMRIAGVGSDPLVQHEWIARYLAVMHGPRPAPDAGERP